MSAESRFTEEERATLHSLAEIFSGKDDRDELRRLVHEGATIREIILAYKMNRRLITALKAVGGLIIVIGGAIAALKSLNLWPK